MRADRDHITATIKLQHEQGISELAGRVYRQLDLGAVAASTGIANAARFRSETVQLFNQLIDKDVAISRHKGRQFDYHCWTAIKQLRKLYHLSQTPPQERRRGKVRAMQYFILAHAVNKHKAELANSDIQSFRTSFEDFRVPLRRPGPASRSRDVPDLVP